MALYFADRVIPDLEDDTFGMDSTLFGNILHILGICTFILDIAISDMRPIA